MPSRIQSVRLGAEAVRYILQTQSLEVEEPL